MAGLSADGFTIKTLEEIKTEISDALRERISPTLDTTDESPLGQTIGIFASHLREVWELAEAVYSSQYADTAVGESLTNVALLTGVQRNPATFSTTVATINIDAGTYAAGSLIASVEDDPTARFYNRDEIGLIGSPADVADVVFISETAGPVRANTGTLNVIAGAVSGWNSVVNTEDATLGTNVETDAELRLRRAELLALRGSTTVEAIRADLLEVDDVVSVLVLENAGDIVDANGLPPHSFEAIVFGGLDADIAETIFATKAAGIQTFGTENISLEDSEGNAHIVNFSRPTSVDIYIEVNLIAESTTYSGDTAVKTALTDLATAVLGVGSDVYASQLSAEIWKQISGIIDVSSVYIGLAPSPGSSATLVMDPRELAEFDTARITVNSTEV